MPKLATTSSKYKMHVWRILTVVLENANHISRVTILKLSFTCLFTEVAGEWVEIPIWDNVWFQGSIMKYMRSVFFWGVLQRMMVIPTYQHHLQGSSNLCPIFKSAVLKPPKYRTVLLTTATLTMFEPQTSSLTGTILKVLEIHSHKMLGTNCI